MSHKKKITLLLVLSVIVFAVGYVLLHANNFGLCNLMQNICTDSMQLGLGKSIVWGIPVVSLILLVLLFFSEKIFKLWSKFSVAFIPLAILWMAFTPVYCGSFFSICLSTDILLRLLSIIFLLISFAIIIYKKVRESKVI